MTSTGTRLSDSDRRLLEIALAQLIASLEPDMAKPCRRLYLLLREARSIRLTQGRAATARQPASATAPAPVDKV
jgi:hypothetical protein